MQGMKSGLVMVLAICGLMATNAWAQPQTMMVPRTITVTGHKQDQFSPDQAILSLSVVTRNTNLKVAKTENDKQMEKLVGITDGFKIPREKVASSGTYVSPEYDYTNNKQVLKGYVVNRSIRVTMDQLDMPEKLMSALVDIKIDQIGGVEFGLADPEKFANKLRVAAFENAKSKASVLATAAGAKLGMVLTMTTDGNSMPMPQPMQMVKAMRAEMAMDGASSVAPTLPGLVALSETVNVSFLLE